MISLFRDWISSGSSFYEFLIEAALVLLTLWNNLFFIILKQKQTVKWILYWETGHTLIYKEAWFSKRRLSFFFFWWLLLWAISFFTPVHPVSLWKLACYNKCSLGLLCHYQSLPLSSLQYLFRSFNQQSWKQNWPCELWTFSIPYPIWNPGAFYKTIRFRSRLEVIIIMKGHQTCTVASINRE